MITRLSLTNFRRYETLDLNFDTDSQMILISGLNGAGKSTILESILYGLYGQGRTGKRNLDSLVRWGAELEGLEVEIEFVVEGAEYMIKRKRVGRVSTAVLYGNGNPLWEGADQVSAEVGRILGMDATGFKLAVTAQQKELDGLASLTPSVRAERLSRLLRLDAITQAKDQARKIYNREKDIVRAMGTLDDVDELKEQVSATQEAVTSALAELAKSSHELLVIETDLSASAAVDAAYQKALTDVARAEGAVSAARAEVVRLSGELSLSIIPSPVPMPEKTTDELAVEATSIERQIARGESAKEVASQHAMLTKERDRVNAQLQTTEKELSTTADITEKLAALRGEHSTNTALLEALTEKLAALRGDAGAADAQAKLLQARLDRLAQTGPVCDACGQDVSENHRHTQDEELTEGLVAAKESLKAISVEGKATKVELEKATLVQQELLQGIGDLQEKERSLERLGRERSELLRRRDTYDAQLGRLDIQEVDLDSLYARKGEIAIQVTYVRESAEAQRVRDAALTRKLDVEMSLSGARERLTDAEVLLASAAVDADLEVQYKERQIRLEARNEEMNMQRHWATELAVAKANLSSAQGLVVRAERQLLTRRVHESKAMAAANSARVLSDVEDRMQKQIRPALEGAVAEKLAILSEGRFVSVRVTDDYDILVEDDGQYRSLSEFSGGEKDLIALAVRLSLAGVVAERHGSGGAGFLILDECFGSQDDGRREAIMSALRNLRSTYGQILLISHVGGLEEAADAVIEVSSAEAEDGSRIAQARTS